VAKRKAAPIMSEYDDSIEPDKAELFAEPSEAIDFETQDIIGFVKKTMDTLPTKYQTILSLFYFQELSHEEIGEVTQLPIGTIKTHLFRARSLLQQRLQKELQMEKAV
jgi:RNA polymerase sigma factor (sigma-70 family)